MKSLLLSFWGLFSLACFAQYETAVFDYQNAYFNNGQKLKAESYLMISGAASKRVDRVEVSAYRANGSEKKPLYTNTWKRSYGNMQEMFQLPFNYKLRGDANYDFKFDYFKPVTKEEKEALRLSLHQALDSYLESTFTPKGHKVKMTSSKANAMSDMNSLMKDALTNYRNESEILFPGFSDVVGRSMEQMTEKRLGSLAAIRFKGEDDSRKEARANLFESRLNDLKALVHSEADQVLNTELMILSDTRKAIDYPVEHTMNILALNAGYGAVYFDGDVKDVSYGHAPYLGMSFPLGNSAFAKPFWSNSSISAGAFLKNFSDRNGNTVTGPVFGRPYYVAYGYRMFQFLRINAGVAALENQSHAGTLSINSFQLRPFVGLSAEINFWMGLGNKR